MPALRHAKELFAYCTLRPKGCLFINTTNDLWRRIETRSRSKLAKSKPHQIRFLRSHHRCGGSEFHLPESLGFSPTRSALDVDLRTLSRDPCSSSVLGAGSCMRFRSTGGGEQPRRLEWLNRRATRKINRRGEDEEAAAALD
ncbi:hypothetical protein Droror1_Dr00015843 [Drosera rotundifolia]